MLFLASILVDLLRVVVVAGQLLVLFFNGGTRDTRPWYTAISCCKLLLVARRLRNQVLILVNLQPQLPDLWRF